MLAYSDCFDYVVDGLKHCFDSVVDGVRHVFFFTHGLPGSGKSTLLTWMRLYFEEVWGYRSNHQFVYLAPLNVVAANIT